ncbi:NYN domain-containing protein [Campylobacter ureolyticus]|uniref:NYN domain-containing protein n=1 Tax=Campylobacter ureolyticus TaxID=827 RepID=UPI0022B306F5|nr:NYN domain-containing protein [Campylobacter ureolyticus]MCZ6168002.1 NYN domain-containing protein [Campylobacter ureolyticus]
MGTKTNYKTDFSKIFKPLKTAVLVDLSFFLKRYKTQFNVSNSEDIAKRLRHYIYKSVLKNNDYLYRIFIYDCEPLEKDVTLPISKRQLNLRNTDIFKFRKALLSDLKQQPYCSVRLGNFDANLIQWKFKNYKLFKKVIHGEVSIQELKDEDFIMDLKQKGVDMKIGLDMATLANKKQVEKIILITADSDFIPAIKLARKEGIIVQLDPMQNKHIKQDLLEHLDILNSVFPKDKTDIDDLFE